MTEPVHHRYARARCRKGSVYVFVLVAIGMATAAGLVGMAMRQRQVEDALQHERTSRCRLHAIGGIEAAIHMLDKDANWRSTYSGGVIGTLNMPDGAVIEMTVADPDDGSLASGDAVVTSTAAMANTKQQYSVTLEEAPDALTDLKQSAIVSKGTIRINGGSISLDRILYGDALQISVTTVNANAKTVKTGLLSVVLSLLGSITGTVTTGEPAPLTPGNTVVALYESGASTLTLPGTRIFENAILTPTVNPWGATNADGIYVVDGGGGTVTFRNVRVRGTLVVKNASQVYIQNAAEILPTSHKHAAIVTDSDLTMGWTANLSEASLSVNFNPAGSGYIPSDNVNDDTYMSSICGYVYSTKSITITDTFYGTGPLIGDTGVTTSSASVTLSKAGWGNTVPEGFESASSKIVVVDEYSFQRTSP